MADIDTRIVDTRIIRFQCPKCGHDLEQTIAQLKSSERMRCPGCGVGINIDTNRLANAADEIQKAIEKVPPEITIRFYRLGERATLLFPFLGDGCDAAAGARAKRRVTHSKSGCGMNL
jgi:predicted RNA-binding Zn-ribbon protein involved in translation (DUF1610 family)